ncbi:hypothetical protein CNYM01_08384 [Colletotrichum nymphaeae SA-01]|uniref:Uncharacterized protein n=1 Tax=Colletotrichum nymphaeae SA-01 TaxID=1460502 RepID=A0A135SM26_9PEZI|nr:hypothetical protein CNYM01_08384 [Colletotrichum nymphaeae SA-01]
MKGSGAFNSKEFNMSSTPWELKNGTKIPYEDVRVKYRVNQAERIIFYNRPTLQKSPWLYLLLAIQPFMTAIILRLTVMLHSKPLGKRIGLVSILSGIDSRSLSSLAGASLPEELSRPVRLTMFSVQTGDKKMIQYRIEAFSEGWKQNRKLPGKVFYH